MSPWRILNIILLPSTRSATLHAARLVLYNTETYGALLFKIKLLIKQDAQIYGS